MIGDGQKKGRIPIYSVSFAFISRREKKGEQPEKMGKGRLRIPGVIGS